MISWRGILDPDDLLAPGRPRQAPRRARRVGAARRRHARPRRHARQHRRGRVDAAPAGPADGPRGRTPVHADVPQHRSRRASRSCSSASGCAIGLFSGEDNLALTLLPAASSSSGSRSRCSSPPRGAPGRRLQGKRPKLATGVETLALAVENTRTMLRHRGSTRIVLGAIAYLGFDMLVLQGAFVAIDAHPVPSFAVVSMCYLIGGLAGSIPLPANLGAVTGMAGMLIVFGVDHNDADRRGCPLPGDRLPRAADRRRDRLPVPAPGVRLDGRRRARRRAGGRAKRRNQRRALYGSMMLAAFRRLRRRS